MKIRSVKAEDLWEIARIDNKAFNKPWTFPRFVEQYERNKEGFLVAEEKTKITGFALIDPGGLLMLIAVDSKHTGKGIGSKLLGASLAFLKKKKVKKASGHVRKSNERVIHFYLKHGFKKERELKGYYSNEDGWLLTKKLA